MRTTRGFLACLVSLLLAAASQAGVGGSWCHHDDEIDPETRREAAARLREVWRAARSGEAEPMTRLFSSQLRGMINTDALRTFLEDSKSFLPEEPPEPMVEASCRAYQFLGGESTLLVTPPHSPLVYRIQEGTGEYFGYLHRLPGSHDERLYSTVLKKEDGEWRTQLCFWGYYSIEGKTAPEWVDRAESLEAEGKLVAAGAALGIAQNCFSPVPGADWNGLQDRFADVSKRIGGKMSKSFSFPIPVGDLEGGPVIYSFKGEYMKDSGAAVVVAVVWPGWDDPNDLKSLAEYIHANPMRAFPDFRSFSARTAYLFFREAPTDASRQYQRFGVVLENRPGTASRLP